MTRPLQAEDLYAIKLVEDPQISPNGERIAYVLAAIDRSSYEYRRSIWLVPTAGDKPTRYTSGDYDTSPRWSPDGRWLAFLRKPAGDVKPKSEDERDRGVAQPQLWVLSAEGGEARQLTWARDGVGEPSWAPEGASIIYAAEVGEADDREAADASLKDKSIPAVRTIDRLWYRLDGKGWNYERRSHLFSISVNGGEPRQLTDGDWDDRSPSCSPDGRRIAFTSDRIEERWTWPGSDIWVLDLPSGALARLTDESLVCGPPAWSPDGQSIAFSAAVRRHFDGYTDVMVVDAGGGKAARRLTTDFAPTFEDTCIDDQRAGHGGRHPVWSSDGSEIYTQAASRGTTQVYAVPLATGKPRVVVGGPRRIYGFSMDRKGRRVALASSDPGIPGDLFAADLVAGGERRLTEVNTGLFSEVQLATPEEFSFTGADGWDIQGWVMRPAGAGGHFPAVLEIHGGPMAMYGSSFFFEFQLLAAHGFAVVYANPRGSTGYGRAFSKAVVNDWGGKDYQDLMAGVDAAIQSGFVDGNRMGVGGGSYGGYMTNWAVSHTDRFKAAVTMRCVANLAGMFGYSDMGWSLIDDFMGAVPWKDLDRLAARSPITYVDRIHTPLLILHSDEDLRCPIEEGEQMFTALKFLQREVRMVRFEGQSHDLSRSGHPRSRVIRLQHIVDWFASHIPAQARERPAALAGARRTDS